MTRRQGRCWHLQFAGHCIVTTVAWWGGDEALEQVELTANVLKTPQHSWGLKQVLEVGLIVLLVLLIIVGLIIGFSMLREDDDYFEPPQKTEPYY